MKKSKSKVVCAMSGGVDSSVAAALLKKQGFDLIGVFIKFWSEPSFSKNINGCCSSESETRARKTASMLDIPFYVLDFREEFKKMVVEYFLKEFSNGRTPNPCVVCNKEVKFGLLLERIRKMGADMMATGHYARLKQRQDKVELWQAKDKTKDQSYFLWQLNQKELRKTLFPLGNYTKKEIRKLAESMNLPASRASESMEICFVPDNLYKFLSRHLKAKSGKIIDSHGRLLGEHNGLFLYTIGQRKGIDLSGGPYYVLKKDVARNILVVTKNEKELFSKELKLTQVNWTVNKPSLPINIKARIRYRHDAVTAKLYYQSGYRLSFQQKQRAVTPGQSAVFYKRNKVLGGGIIN